MNLDNSIVLELINCLKAQQRFIDAALQAIDEIKLDKGAYLKGDAEKLAAWINVRDRVNAKTAQMKNSLNAKLLSVETHITQEN